MIDRHHLAERARAKLHPAASAPELRVPFTTRAAVLMPLFVDDEGDLSVWLLRKTEGTRKHAGQVALPGGKSEPHDSSLLDTALREAHEEIQLPRDAVEILGALDPYPTITGFVVTPFVALLRRPFTPVPDTVEIARAFPARLATFAVEGKPHPVSVLTWKRVVPAYDVEGEIVWGATAAILQDAAKRLLGLPAQYGLSSAGFGFGFGFSAGGGAGFSAGGFASTGAGFGFSSAGAGFGFSSAGAGFGFSSAAGFGFSSGADEGFVSFAADALGAADADVVGAADAGDAADAFVVPDVVGDATVALGVGAAEGVGVGVATGGGGTGADAGVDERVNM